MAGTDGRPVALVWDDALAAYDFGEGHPLAPIRVELTVDLIRESGLLTAPNVIEVPPGPQDEEELLRLHRRGLRPGRPARVGRPRHPGRLGLRPRARRQPGVRRDARGVPARLRRLARGRPPGLGGRGRPRVQPGRGPAPRHAGPRRRVLRLQRPGRGHRLAARARRRTGLLRRRRRPPRRRRRGHVRRRPAGADGLDPRIGALPLPRHRRQRGHRRAPAPRARRPTCRCTPARTATCGSTRSTRGSSRWSAPSPPTSWSPSSGATPTPPTRWPTWPSRSTSSSRSWPACTAWPTRSARAAGSPRAGAATSWSRSCRAPGRSPSPR